jgi:hypothetical protein
LHIISPNFHNYPVSRELYLNSLNGKFFKNRPSDLDNKKDAWLAIPAKHPTHHQTPGN